MKKIILLGVIVAMSTLSQAQLKSKSGGETEQGSTGELVSQDIIAATWSDGSYPGRSENGGMWEPLPSSKPEIKFTKNAEGKVTSIVIGNTEYKANTFTGSSFVNLYSYSSDRLFLTSSTIIRYYSNNTTGNVEVKQFWGEKPKGVGALSKEIAAYLTAAKAQIDKDKENYAAQQADASEKAAKSV